MFILTSFPCAQMVCLRPFEQEVVGSSWLLIPAGARSQLWIEHCLLLTLSLSGEGSLEKSLGLMAVVVSGAGLAFRPDSHFKVLFSTNCLLHFFLFHGRSPGV